MNGGAARAETVTAQIGGQDEVVGAAGELLAEQPPALIEPFGVGHGLTRGDAGARRLAQADGRRLGAPPRT